MLWLWQDDAAGRQAGIVRLQLLVGGDHDRRWSRDLPGLQPRMVFLGKLLHDGAQVFEAIGPKRDVFSDFIHYERKGLPLTASFASIEQSSNQVRGTQLASGPGRDHIEPGVCRGVSAGGEAVKRSTGARQSLAALPDDSPVILVFRAA